MYELDKLIYDIIVVENLNKIQLWACKSMLEKEIDMIKKHTVLE